MGKIYKEIQIVKFLALLLQLLLLLLLLLVSNKFCKILGSHTETPLSAVISLLMCTRWVNHHSKICQTHGEILNYAAC